MPNPGHFSPELFKFLRQLKRNNNRDWFARNKELYQRDVVVPALAFISAFAPHLQGISPYFVADARPTRGSLFRIYRDTRFSADKKPYKTHVGIHFSYGGGKDVHAPVFYLNLAPDDCFVAAGVWHPDSRALTKLRTAVVSNANQWAKLRKKLSLEGDRLQRPPRGFPATHPFIEDIKLKSFVSSQPLSEEQVCSAGFMREFTAACRKLSPLVEFTTVALGLQY